MTGVGGHSSGGGSLLVALTDDELVALALRAGQHWPAALPTVDMENEEQIARAGFRGVRSLIARALLSETDDVTSTPLGRVSAAVFGGGARLATYPGSADRRAVYRDWASVYFDNGAAGWLVDDTSGRGIHVFEESSEEACLERVATMVTAAFEGDDGATALLGTDPERCVVVSGQPSQSGTQSLSARKGEMTLWLSVNGAAVEERSVTIDAIDETVRAIAEGA